MRKLLVCAMCMLMLLALGCAGESKRTANNNAKHKRLCTLLRLPASKRSLSSSSYPCSRKSIRI